MQYTPRYYSCVVDSLCTTACTTDDRLDYDPARRSGRRASDGGRDRAGALGRAGCRRGRRPPSRAAAAGRRTAAHRLKGRLMLYELQEVTKSYGAVTAVDSIDLVIEHRDFTVVAGPSGSCKTTLLP